KAGIFADPLLEPNYKMAVSCLKHGINLAQAFLKKSPANTVLKDQLANSFGDLSWYALFTKEPNTAIWAAKNAGVFGKQYDWVNTNLALGYLLSGDFDKAEQVYRAYKDKFKGNGLGTFKADFLNDLKSISDAGIINLKDKKMSAEIIRIKTILGKSYNRQ
ncbi:MAG: hypothetical protein JWR09_1817, partial [Mucilaginibacter sp.]|nr:hypothetical protein [Mucilaginibacter sp.]